MRINKRGSVHLAAIVVAAIAVVVLLVFTFFQVLQGRDDLTTDSAKTFSDCKRLRMSQILETYPEQCVTESGKKFTNPAQTIEDWN